MCDQPLVRENINSTITSFVLEASGTSAPREGWS